MRTTLSLDDDVLLAVEERARRENRTAGEVLSELARQALTQQQNAYPDSRPESFHGFEPFNHHEFWTCSVSLLDDELIDHSRLHGHRQVTDAYLLALAAANGGRFATLDPTIPIDAVRDATVDNLTLI